MYNSITLNELKLDKLTYTFNSKSDYYSILNKILTDLHPILGTRESLLGNVELVLGEAINNAITHGNNGDVNKDVIVSVWVESNTLIVTVQDQGTGFNFNSIPDPTLPENKEKLTGRGVFIIKSLADLVLFESNGSIVEIHFKF
jgi:serine/threonine-protein kinase RsbW